MVIMLWINIIDLNDVDTCIFLFSYHPVLSVMWYYNRNNANN